MKFCILRNTDDTLSVYFSDDTEVHGFRDEDVDIYVLDYRPGIKKEQVFDLDAFQDATCH